VLKIVYRYDGEPYVDGQMVQGRGDSFPSLTANQKVVETRIRDTLKNGRSVRATSLFTWENEVLARRLWMVSKKKYLY
jgi:hypothetical protein